MMPQNDMSAMDNEADGGEQDLENIPNMAMLGDGTFENAKDGDEVTATIKGTVMDGGKSLSITEVNGVPVQETNEEDDSGTKDLQNRLTDKLKQREKMQMGGMMGSLDEEE